MITELKPLVEKAKELQGVRDAEDIYTNILQKAEAASTPSMGKSLCEYVKSMTHPKAWGDRFVSDYGNFAAWCNYLSQLSSVAQQCWNQISINNPPYNAKT